MKKHFALKLGLLIILIVLIFNLAESAYFGWNMTAQSFAEAFWDNVAAIGIGIGLAIILGWAIGITAKIRVNEPGWKEDE
ncbi:hypothetical protein JCM15765_00540 [Paradesulfitobacterium aromaticivorans]